jgi:hypothetical protein
MAYLATLLLVPVEAVSRVHTRESLASCVAHSSHCSHFIAFHADIGPFLDGGTPLQSEMWHPIAKPHYRLPSELYPFVDTLRRLESDEQIKNDSWTLAEVRKLREACVLSIQHGMALVIILSNTLSRPPMPKKV